MEIDRGGRKEEVGEHSTPTSYGIFLLRRFGRGRGGDGKKKKFM